MGVSATFGDALSLQRGYHIGSCDCESSRASFVLTLVLCAPDLVLLLKLTSFGLHNNRRCSPGTCSLLAQTGVEVLASASTVGLFACQLVSCYVCSRQSPSQCPDSCVEEPRLCLSTQATAHSSTNLEAPAPHRHYPAKVAKLASADAMQLREKVSALHAVQKLWLDLP